MSTETQRAELIQKLRSVPLVSAVPSLDDERVMLMVGGYCKKAAAMLEAQAAELAAIKADIAEYVHIASEQATVIEALRKDAKRGFMCATSFHHETEHAARGVRIFPDLENLKSEHPCWQECGVVEVLILDAAMQTKEAS